MHAEEISPVQVQPADKEKIKKIWLTAGIMAGVTIIEFIIAFTMGPSTTKVAIFIGLTIVKAFYIVAEFMHLKYEVKVLIWSILIPLIFVVWMLIAFLYEGGAIFDVRY
ncbi:MAG: cytochrome C oxidase subunit IV family protein [Bacteroidota bacterium]